VDPNLIGRVCAVLQSRRPDDLLRRPKSVFEVPMVENRFKPEMSDFYDRSVRMFFTTEGTEITERTHIKF